MADGLALLTVYTTPVVYLYLDRFQYWLRGVSRELSGESSEISTIAAE